MDEDTLLPRGIDDELDLNVTGQVEPGNNGPEEYGATLGIPGVDYSVGCTSSLVAALKNGGYKFAVRYVGTPGRGKSLTAAEVLALKAAGVNPVAVYEDRAGTATTGFVRGTHDAESAFTDMHKLGAPDTAPCYFAVDTDTTGPAVAPYFEGLHAHYPPQRIGIYAGLHVIQWIADNKLANWFWQTRAWSKVNGQFVWDQRDHMRQFPVAKPFYVLGSCDLDWAMQPNYGQWATPEPPPPPAPPHSEHRTLYLSYPHMHGDDVKWLQAQLRAILIAPHLAVDSDYGPETVSAVKSFQKHEGLVADGVCGPKTWTALEHS